MQGENNPLTCQIIQLAQTFHQNKYFFTPHWAGGLLMGTLTSYFSNEDSYGAWGFELEEKVKAGLVSNAANTSKGNISLCGER